MSVVVGRTADAAVNLLDLATSAGVVVAREFVAPGPVFAHDDSLIAVHLLTNTVEVQPVAGLPMQNCPLVPVDTFVVTYVKCCVPVPGQHGETPTPETVTAFSVEFENECTAIYDAVVNGVDERTHTVLEGRPDRPSGKAIAYRFSVRVGHLL